MLQGDVMDLSTSAVKPIPSDIPEGGGPADRVFGRAQGQEMVLLLLLSSSWLSDETWSAPFLISMPRPQTDQFFSVPILGLSAPLVHPDQ